MLEIAMFSSLGFALVIVAPLLTILAYRNWRRVRRELPPWRNVAAGLAMLLALSNWTGTIVILVARVMGSRRVLISDLSINAFLATLIAGVLLALALKGTCRVQLFIAAVILLVGSSWPL